MRYLSVCSGIEAATVAWHPMGWAPVAFSEVDAFPSAVLAHHYPTVPNRGDMTKFQEWPDADVDVLVGGTPCQSFSVAGLRAGLDDPRGSLMLVYLAIARRYRPRWVVWENVPGVLSADDGRAFGSLLGGLAELGYGFAYRVLDAQYFGLAQRRKRVFVVGCLGDWRRAAAVLFERASLSGHPAPRREAGQDTAARAASGADAGRLLGGLDYEQNAHGPDEPTGPLLKGSPTGGGRPLPAIGVIAPDVALCLETTCHDYSRADSFTLIAHASRAAGFDASEDGTGRGTPLVPIALFDERQITSPDSRMACRVDAPVPTMHEKPFAVAFQANASASNTMNPSQCAPTLDKGKADGMSALIGSRVRRLTPRECERLQGFPDDYTLIPYRGKPAADGPRYKALGNSMAVPVMRWIGERITQVERLPLDDRRGEA